MTKAKTLHAVSDGKVLRPEEAVNLEPNVRYLVTIEREEAIGVQSLWDVLSEFSGTVEGPRDWSEEHDHYLYGTPKRGKGRRQRMELDRLHFIYCYGRSGLNRCFNGRRAFSTGLIPSTVTGRSVR